MLVFISGFRNSCVGIDTSMYQYIWEGYRPGVYRNLDIDSEYGFASILPVGYIVSKYSKNVCFSFLLFYSSVLFHTLEFAAERQAIAFWWSNISLPFFNEKKFKSIYINYVSFIFLSSF